MASTGPAAEPSTLGQPTGQGDSSEAAVTDHEQLNTALSNRKGTRHRTSGQERWLDFHCPVHDDRHRSASYQPETGSLICRVCGKLEPAATLRALGRLPD